MESDSKGPAGSEAGPPLQTLAFGRPARALHLSEELGFLFVAHARATWRALRVEVRPCRKE
jgi:hypothetical protein